MVLQLLLPYVGHIAAALAALAVLRALSQGRATTRERDLHGRTFLVSGAFSPLGLTLLHALAQRGAKIVALSPHPIDSNPVTILVSLLRSTSNNELIYAEQCNLADPADIRKFCTHFLTGGKKGETEPDTRLDGLIFAHEYQHIGVPRFLRSSSPTYNERDSQSLATFLLTTLLLPALLVAPVERDIRILTIVNPFYAAATPSFNPTFPSPTANSIFLSEGQRSLRTIIFTRHLQRIFDSLPKPPLPKPEHGSTTSSSTVPIPNSRLQKSNIVAVSVSPGISRLDTVSKLLNADWRVSSETGFSWFGVLLYMLIAPLLYLTTKSPTSSIQSILHALFLPTPFKVLSSPSTDSNTPTVKTEVLKPGALYADCASVKLDIPMPSSLVESNNNNNDDGVNKKKEEVLQIEDDGEYGGEIVGRWVWEAYEAGLKVWDKDHAKAE